jgi:two-component system, chemotaxis family, chemotaxis protein CheY
MNTTTRILVIDDDAHIRALLRTALEHTGYEVAEAPNGVVGMQHYRTQPTDLVITDLCMPERNGLDVIIDLRRDFPKTRIMAMSGGAGGAHDLLPVAEGLGAVQTIQKPFDVWAFIETVQNVLAS